MQINAAKIIGKLNLLKAPIFEHKSCVLGKAPIAVETMGCKVRSHKKKRYYLGIFPKRRTPPPPPLLGTPYPNLFTVYYAF